MFKNVASKFIFFAFDATTNVPKTGDAANITAYVAKDYGTVTVLADTSATEMDATNAPGYYLFDAAQAETNGDCLLITAKSSTANIKVLGSPPTIFTRPTTGWLAPATAGRTLVVDAAGLADANMVKAGPTGSGTAQTAGDVYSKVSALTYTVANQVDVNVVDWKGSAAPAMTGDAYARIGAAGAGLTAVALTGTQTFNNTGTWTGNIVGTLSTLTTYTGNTPQTGDNFTRMGAPAGASISADIAAKPTAAQNATAVLTTQMTESYAALHTVPTLAQIMFEMRGLQAEKGVATTVLTIKKIDGATNAETFTLSDATLPVSITRAT